MNLDFTPSAEFVSVLGIEEFGAQRQYGRDRGLNPVVTEAQTRAVDKLNQRLNTTARANRTTNDDELVTNFDLKSQPRAILFDAPLSKRALNSIVGHTSKRYGYLMSDVLLITTLASSKSSIFGSTEKVDLHQVFQLDNISITDLRKIDDNEDVCAFEIRTSDRPYVFIAESESDKKIWLEEIENTICAIMLQKENKKLGWYHEVFRGSFHSAALLGQKELVQKYIDKSLGVSLDIVDEAGMTPLHWACANGQMDVVEMLVLNGADVDFLNLGLNSSLHLAAAFSHRFIVIYLLDCHANMHATNLKDYDSLAMTALYSLDNMTIFHIVFALKARGVDLNKQLINGATILHECAARNLNASIQALVDAGADVNAKHGRTGLTPLQLACGAQHVDPETLRTLLEKGSLPNWKDVNGNNAFDMLITSNRGMTNTKDIDTSTDAGMKRVVEEVSEFVLESLLAICELVKKGCRYNPSKLSHLRPSFIDMVNNAQQLWNRLEEPPGFSDYVRSVEGALVVSKWVDDSASQTCLLCVDKFTYSNRRHHCRTCGVLCCDACSFKRLNIKPVPGSTSPVPNTPKKGDGERVCDSCFNRLLYEWEAWSDTAKRIRKEQQRQEQMIMEQRAKEVAAKLATQGQSRQVRRAGAATAGLNANMNDTMRALEERGDKLKNTAQNAEVMRNAAADFAESSRQLRQQLQARNGG